MLHAFVTFAATIVWVIAPSWISKKETSPLRAMLIELFSGGC
ncbi:hypothetical protein PIECOFPK_00599 [Mycovorax composti]|jgi:hypothetical protein|uniref:Uncharacterized protein n=2 Tax=Chitinophagaceae TaxID=563835 RepID=A0ABZ2EH98_9BACT